jgi:hypothetical protein
MEVAASRLRNAGLKRQARDVTPTLGALLREQEDGKRRHTLHEPKLTAKTHWRTRKGQCSSSQGGQCSSFQGEYRLEALAWP